MPLLACCVAVAVLTVPLFGGRLRHLADLRLRHASLLTAALVLQVLVIVVFADALGWVAPVAHLGSYALVGGFVAANRRVPGLLLVAAGALMNVAAIAANGGVMPESPAAARAAGIAQDTGQFENSAVIEHPRLRLLGDVFAVPRPLPLANVFSAGDVVLVVGATVLLHRQCGSLRRHGGSASRRGATIG